MVDITRKHDLHFWYKPVDAVALRDLQPSNETGDLVCDGKLFTRFDEIKELRFAGCLIARRSMDVVQKIKVELDGETYDWEFDQRDLCGWRSMGIEPILEIENEVTQEKWWYAYRFHSSGVWMWCQLLPHTGEEHGYRVVVQAPRVLFLLFTLIYMAGLYGAASIGLIFFLASFIGS